MTFRNVNVFIIEVMIARSFYVWTAQKEECLRWTQFLAAVSASAPLQTEKCGVKGELLACMKSLAEMVQMWRPSSVR